MSVVRIFSNNMVVFSVIFFLFKEFDVKKSHETIFFQINFGVGNIFSAPCLSYNISGNHPIPAILILLGKINNHFLSNSSTFFHPFSNKGFLFSDYEIPKFDAFKAYMGHLNRLINQLFNLNQKFVLIFP
jgi:hypothetical protein